MQVKLTNPRARAYALQEVHEAPDGHIVEIRPPSGTRSQECKYHAQIRDIAKQCYHSGKKWSEGDWKRLLVAAFELAMKESGSPLEQASRIAPALTGGGIVYLEAQTRHFTKSERSQFIEYLFAWGADQGVIWSDQLTEDYQIWEQQMRE